MVRLSSCLIFVALLCASVATVRGDDWFPDPFKWDSPPPADAPPPPLYPSPDTPSPYYDAPPYVPAPPVEPPVDVYPPTDGPGPSPWLSSSLWATKTDAWHPFSPETPISVAFGADAVKVYGDISLSDGILSKGEDGFSQLLKEAITALLNSIDAHFKYTEDEIKKAFSHSLDSEADAHAQADLFKAANEAYLSGP